jgi:hypothetical protein
MVKFKPRKFWSEHREASLNWLALGMLLAAWNAADGDGSSGDIQDKRNTAAAMAHRPSSLQSHSFVSVRTARRSAAVDR